MSLRKIILQKIEAEIHSFSINDDLDVERYYEIGYNAVEVKYPAGKNYQNFSLGYFTAKIDDNFRLKIRMMSRHKYLYSFREKLPIWYEDDYLKTDREFKIQDPNFKLEDCLLYVKEKMKEFRLIFDYIKAASSNGKDAWVTSKR